MTTLKSVALAAAMAAMLCAAGARAQSVAPASAQSSGGAMAATHAQVCYIVATKSYYGMRLDQRDFDAGRPWGSTLEARLDWMTGSVAAMRKAARGTGTQGGAVVLMEEEFKVDIQIQREVYELLQQPYIQAAWVPRTGARAQRRQALQFARYVRAYCMRMPRGQQ